MNQFIPICTLLIFGKGVEEMSLTFEEAAELVKTFAKRPADNDLLELYGLFKQATKGDNTTSAPWAVQFEAKAKWNAWESRKGMSQEEAKAKYVEKVEALKATHQN